MSPLEKKFLTAGAAITHIMPVSPSILFFIQFVKGKLYVTGGLHHGDMSTMVDVIDVWKGGRNVVRTELSPMRHPRMVHATAATGHHIFVFGGYADTFIITCEVFNTITNT